MRRGRSDASACGLHFDAVVALALGLLAGCQCHAPVGAPPGPAPAASQPSASDADLDRRVAAVTLRERAVELRERSVTEREAKLQEALVTPVPFVVPGVPPAPKAHGAQSAHSQQEAELAHRRVLDAMAAKGLVAADLPADAARLDDQIYAAMRAGEYDRSFDLTERLGRAVAAVSVDQPFLDAKMRRVAALRSKRQVGAAATADIDALLQEVTSLAADGQYGTANERVNRIAALLR